MMFGRNSSDRTPRQDPRTRLRDVVTRLDPPGTREVVAVPVSPAKGPSAAPALTGTVIAADDRLEGTLRTERSLRILGVVEGAVESTADVRIEQGARVKADISAEEVVIAGVYSGKLTCRQRLEILPTGRVSGTIETVKLLLHEGGFVDGGLHMQKRQEAPDPTLAPHAGVLADPVQGATAGSGARSGGMLREPAGATAAQPAVEPGLRRPVATGSVVTSGTTGSLEEQRT